MNPSDLDLRRGERLAGVLRFLQEAAPQRESIHTRELCVQFDADCPAELRFNGSVTSFARFLGRVGCRTFHTSGNVSALRLSRPGVLRLLRRFPPPDPVDAWLARQTLLCPRLHARITVAQCRRNRRRPDAAGFGDGPGRPVQCRTCPGIEVLAREAADNCLWPGGADEPAEALA